jgi:ATP-dependent helicase/nuclease subunit B
MSKRRRNEQTSVGSFQVTRMGLEWSRFRLCHFWRRAIVARMAATVHILCGPTGSGKTARLLAEYRQRAQAGLGAALWLAPTGRAGGAVLQRLLAQPQSCSKAPPALLSPQVVALADFAAELIRHHDPVARPLSPVELRLIVAELIAQQHEHGDLSYFASIAETAGFAEAVLGFLDELNKLGIRPDEFGRVASEAAGRGSGRRTKLRQCAELFRHYQRQLDKQFLLHKAVQTWRAARLIHQGKTAPFDGVRSVFLDGFVELTAAEEALVGELTAWAEELWVALPGDEEALRTELFTSTARLRGWLEEVALGARVVMHSPPMTDARPTGIRHLERALFGEQPEVAADGAGLDLIEAPGAVGEARLVARRIVGLLLEGVPPGQIVVTGRDLTRSLDLLEEVFAEYRIPVDIEATRPLLANPAVRTLLRAVRLPDEGWPFAGVTALLRSNYFDPEWAECLQDPDVARHAEGLLRLVGEPRDREAFLKAVEIWADSPPEGLEDELAEEPQRLRTVRLARRCRPFLNRFFRAWDELPRSATVGEFIAWLKRFASNIGLMRSAQTSADDEWAFERLWEELEHWARRGQGRLLGGRSLARAEFIQRLSTAASATILPRSLQGPNRVRVVSAEDARYLEADYFFVIGLGERSFPDLSAPLSLLDDGDRIALRQAGLRIPHPSERLAQEQLLFYQLVTLPRKGLVLSYAAVDEKGQDELPSSFLRVVRDCFTPEAIPVKRQRMLIEGITTEPPLSDAEWRVRWAINYRDRPFQVPEESQHGLSDDLQANIRAAARMAAARFGSEEYGLFDGRLSDPALRDELAAVVGPHKVFSPTALEAYVACPFRFFMGHVLRLEPLEEPSEEVEHTRRGAAVHRALSRFHRRQRERHPEWLADAIIPESAEVDLLDELDRAIAEYMDRAPSPASKELWRLEGERLKRAARNYRGHWQTFLEPWRKQGAVPRPQHFEAAFGPPRDEALPADGQAAMPHLTIQIGAVEVRIGGRIDRLDVAEIAGGLGFWVIDYKTGRSAYHTGKELERFEKLQLPLYALAAERLFFAGQRARPLGLAYWMVTEKGPKPALPPGRHALAWLASAERWERFREQLQAWVVALAGRMRQGMFPLAPRSEQCTTTCQFGEVCRITQSRGTGKVWDLALPSGEAGKEADEPA